MVNRITMLRSTQCPLWKGDMFSGTQSRVLPVPGAAGTGMVRGRRAYHN